MSHPPAPAGQEPCPDPCNLIVNYIPTPVTDAELHAMFSQYGELVSARVIIDRATGVPKGYGFVKFKNVADANRAMTNMTGFVIHGKRLKVTPARGFQSASIDSYVSRVQAPPFCPPQAVPMMAPIVFPGQIVASAPHIAAPFVIDDHASVPFDMWQTPYSGPSFEISQSQFGGPSPPPSVEHFPSAAPSATTPRTAPSAANAISPPQSF